MRDNLLKLLLTTAILLLSHGIGHAQQDGPTVLRVPELPTITRGQTVVVHGDKLPTPGVVKVALRTGKTADDSDVTLVDASVAGDGQSLTFKIPTDHFNPGRYLVYVVPPTGAELAVPGELRVVPDDTAKVQIDSIFPTTVYPDEQGRYKFEISGTNLGQLATDNTLQVLGVGWQPSKSAADCTPSGTPSPEAQTSAPQTSTSQTSAAKTPPPEGPCLSYAPGMEGRKLQVSAYEPGRFSEPVQIRIKVGNNLSEPRQLTFARVGPLALRLWALSISLLIALLVLALVWQGVGHFKIDGEDYRPLAAFFLDRQTDSYSLSKFQLFAWTAIAVFAYIFVYFCHVLVQWNFDFPAIPDGWPTLLGLSAATTVTAVSITNNHGSKGAGPVQPSLADFITTGGLVATDRFQFFVWTLVGCAGFLGLVLLPDPATLTKLPDVPSGFLYLMGISASGYLGGKLLRAPGPVISQLLVTRATPRAAGTNATMIIDLKGENLSKDASLKVDGNELRKDQFLITPVITQDAASDPSFCTELTVTLTDSDKYLEGSHELTITNKDGQMAVSTFPLDPLSIDPDKLPTVPVGTTPTKISITGKNFALNMSGQWIDPAGASSQLTTADITEISDTRLEVSLTPGATPGKGTLVLISATNLRASAQLEVT